MPPPPERRSASAPKRLRRSREEARAAILEAAAKHLREGGPDAVRVQHVAADVGVTDAAVHHHFGSREGLLRALLREAGRRLRAELRAALEEWDGETEGLQRIAELIADVYVDQGHARLALWLALSGVESTGQGLFAPLVDAVQQTRLRAVRVSGGPRPRRSDAQYDVALMNVALAAEPLFGPPFLRSVGLPDDAEAEDRFRRWLVARLAGLLAGERRG